MKLKVHRDSHPEKSTVNFLKDGAKHYHEEHFFSFIPKAALKKAIENKSSFVVGELGEDAEAAIGNEGSNYSFSIRYYSDKSVRIGCVVLTPRQFNSLKRWAGVKEKKRESNRNKKR